MYCHSIVALRLLGYGGCEIGVLVLLACSHWRSSWSNWSGVCNHCLCFVRVVMCCSMACICLGACCNSRLKNFSRATLLVVSVVKVCVCVLRARNRWGGDGRRLVVVVVAVVFVCGLCLQCC